jgi:16S rRNA (cytosine967-C5)-methyltransferase
MGLAEAARPGEAARQTALDILTAILKRRQPFDEVFERIVAGSDPRERAFIYALVQMVLRRKGEISAVVARFLAKPLPRSAGPTDAILLIAGAQLLFMDVPPHAAIDLAVTAAQRDPDARHFAKLVNGVLRNIARQQRDLAGDPDSARLNTPDWLWRRWQACYGEKTAGDIAKAHAGEPPLDISAKVDAAIVADRLGGILLPTGTIRLRQVPRPIEQLAGFSEGAWWVQDAAARLPALLLGDVRGKSVLDLCAAPGGKTAQLAAAGARVTALDKSPQRMKRLEVNMARLALGVETVIADAANFAPKGRYDCVLLDAPCSATGTIRRHPDLPYIKDEAQVGALALLQQKLLDQAASLVAETGILLYCTCSLEPEESEAQAACFLKRNPNYRRFRITPAELAGQGQFISPDGDLRTHPAMKIGPETGLDGFFAARFIRA